MLFGSISAALFLLALAFSPLTTVHAVTPSHAPSDRESLLDKPTKELYGYYEDNLFLHFVCGQPTHLLITYPREKQPTAELPPRDFEIEIGQNLLNQFAIPRLLHVVMDKFSCTALPVQGLQTVPFYLAHYVLSPKFADRVGGVTFELWNIRVHKVRVASHEKDYPTKDRSVRVVNDYLGGKIVDDRNKLLLKFFEHQMNFTNEAPRFVDSDPATPPSSDYILSPSIVFIDKDRIRVAIKGFNLVMTTNYEVSGSQGMISDYNQVGELWTRVTDCAVIFDIDLREHRRNRRPVAFVPRKPQLFLGEMRFKFSGNFGDLISSYLSNTFQSAISEYFELMLSKILQQEMPRISELLYDIIEHSIIGSLDLKLGEVSLEPSSWPRLAVEDIRWSVEDYKIKIGGFVRHIPAIERDVMVERMNAWTSAKKNQDKIEKCKTSRYTVGKLGVTPPDGMDVFKVEYTRPYENYTPLDESTGAKCVPPNVDVDFPLPEP